MAQILRDFHRSGHSTAHQENRIMAHALLSKAYAGNKAGTLLKDITDREVKTIERLGLGSEVKEEPAKADAKGKGEKTAD